MPQPRPADDTRIQRYLRPHRGPLIWGAFLLLVTNGLDKAIPWMLGHAVDGLSESDLPRVRNFAIAVVATAAVMWVVRTASRIVIFNVGRDVEYDVRNDILRRVHLLGPSFFRRMGTGDIMSRATNDVAQVRLLVGFGAMALVNTVLAFAASIGLMLTISPLLTLYALLPLPLVVLFAQTFGKRLYERSRHAQEALGRLSDRAQESVSGVRVVRAYGLEDHEERRFEEVNDEVVRRNMRLVVLRTFMWPVLMSITSIGTLVVIWAGGEMVVEREITIGQFAQFHGYLGQLAWPMLGFGWMLSVLQRGRASYARILDILTAEPDVVEAPDARPAPDGGGVEVRDLRYAYGDRDVLRGVSFEVPPGESLAIMGPTGSGKTTLASLLPRLLPAPPGTIFLGGQDVTELGVKSLRRQIGYAQQEPFLFSSTVARNIAFGLDDDGRPDAFERVRDAADAAGILEEVEALPDGFDTVVGERGVQLSGGQKQRVALARALLAEPSVVVLDDPLSAVDAKTEARILSALDRAGEGRTLILVTHRVAAAARADRVVVLEDGRVVERGTHDELVAGDGLYARLAARQRLEEELSAL